MNGGGAMTGSVRTILLLSGGVDSALCARMLVGRSSDLTCLFVDYGQVAAGAELAAARRIAAALDVPLSVRRLEGAEPRGAGEHVGRNALLLATAAFEAGGGPAELVIGIHAGTGYYDCSPRFVEMMDLLVAEQSDGAVRVSAPLRDWSKSQVFEAFATSELDIGWTHSCEAADDPCGRCSSCRDRAAA